MTIKTHHACALEINQTGILIIGKSGSGKTSLMMGLLERAKHENLKAFLISDDRVHLNCAEGRLKANTPETIAGLVEIRGYGITTQPYKKTTIINLVVELIADDQIDRMPDQKFYGFESLNLPMLEVPQRHENQAIRIIFAWLIKNADLQVD